MNRTMWKKFVLVAVAITLAFQAGESEAGRRKAKIPDGFVVEDFLAGLNGCITLAFSPDGRLFYVEKNTGKVRVVENGRPRPEPWADLAVDDTGERGLLGLVFDPKFSENGYVYLYYSVNRSLNNRVVRMKEVGGKGVEMTTVLDIPDHSSASNHNGGNLSFGPDGMLYVTVGDGGGKPGKPGKSQEDTNLLGKILRVDVRGALPVVKEKLSELIYAKGLRNSFDMAWNPDDQVLYATENGPVGRDEINRITEGGNYGWPKEKGWSDKNDFDNPIVDFGSRSVAPTGITFYPRDGVFPDEYKGNMLIVDYNYGRVYRARLDYVRPGRLGKDDMEVWMPTGFAGTGFADIVVGPDGALYLAGFTKIIRIRYVR